MIKKLILGLLALLIIGVGTLFIINGEDKYEADKYNLTATNGLEKGSKIDFTLPDQFNKPHSLKSDTQILILTFSKNSGHIVKNYLGKQEKDFLDKHKAMFIADISPMPVVIRNTFALPDLKKSPFAVLLIYDKELAKKVKPKESSDKIVVVYLKNKSITDIKYISNEDELKEIFKK
jgi:hypothetical protein